MNSCQYELYNIWILKFLYFKNHNQDDKGVKILEWNDKPQINKQTNKQINKQKNKQTNKKLSKEVEL